MLLLLFSCCHVRLFCDSMDYGLPGFSVHEIFQARILEWVAMPSSRGISQPGIEPMSPALAGEFFTTEPQGKLYIYIYEIILLYTLNILQFCQLYLSKTGKKWPCYLKSGWLKTHFTHMVRICFLLFALGYSQNEAVNWNNLRFVSHFLCLLHL